MLNKDNAVEWMKIFGKKIADNKQLLSDYDDQIGDGDHGNNMDRGMQGVIEQLENNEFKSEADLFKNVAMALLSKVGGASGPLYGTAFIEMSKKTNETTDLAELIQAGAQGIAKRGGAVAGDKTMLDVWLSAAEVLKIEDIITSDQISEFVESTKKMQAKKGRASYLGERSVGFIDPGAASSGMLFDSMIEAKIV